VGSSTQTNWTDKQPSNLQALEILSLEVRNSHGEKRDTQLHRSSCPSHGQANAQHHSRYDL